MLHRQGLSAALTETPVIGIWAARVRRTWYLVTHLRGHVALKRMIASGRSPGIQGEDRLARFKYLRAYLARFLTTQQKYACLLGHHRYWREIGATDKVRGLLAGRTPLWRVQRDGRVISIEVRPASRTAIEGELALNFLLDGLLISTLTFSIVPGSVFGQAALPAVFVGGIQGYPGCREAVRQAAKLNSEVAPTRTLLIAMQALASVLRIETIICISASHQIAADALIHAPERAEAYDLFWQSEGATSEDGKVYLVPADFAKIAYPEPTGSHRTRARRRRLHKEALYEEIQASAGHIFLLASVSVLIPERNAELSKLSALASASASAFA